MARGLLLKNEDLKNRYLWIIAFVDSAGFDGLGSFTVGNKSFKR